MAAMIRKQIYITAEQDEALKTQARALGATEAELIRSGLDRELALDDATARRLVALERMKASWREADERAMRRGTYGVRTEGDGGRGWTRDEIYDHPLRGLPGRERVDIRPRHPGDPEE
ncbi:MAG TPA: hypothetical protein VF902_07000 [Coriobacteriia bacterium]